LTARPGGNITWLTVQAGPELAGEWLELIIEIVPRAHRIAWLRDALNPVSAVSAASVLGDLIEFWTIGRLRNVWGTRRTRA
jgi:hypothetical protein